MAPLVQVPTNFGRQHIGSLMHSNLTLNLKDGRKSRANSLILSFNSPVIESLVASLDLTSLDMQDFQETAVNCFVDCLYTGEIEKVVKPVFREVHKMAKVFNVFWLVARCVGYFKGLVEAMNDDSYEDMLFLFEEADYMFTSMKERNFIDIAITKIGSVKSNKTLFIEKFMEEFNNHSIHQLDLILELAGCDLHIVVQSLTGQLRKHLSVQGAVFTENSRYLLNNCDLSICHRNNRMAYENMFDILQGIQNMPYTDLQWLFTLHRRSSKEAATAMELETAPPSARISNLFHTFDRFKDLSFDVLVDSLADDAEVKNLLMFAEALWSWMIENRRKNTLANTFENKDTKPSVIICSPALLKKIVAIKQNRGWNTVPKECFDLWQSYGVSTQFFDKLKQSDPLFVSDNQKISQVIYCHKPAQITLIQLAEVKNKLMFYFKHPGITDCGRAGQCGFILKTTPLTEENPDLFDIQLCTDHSEYSDEIHIHDDLVRAEDMHFIIVHWNSKHVPVSWSGKLVRHKLTFLAPTWKWGWFCPPSKRQCRIKVLYNF